MLVLASPRRLSLTGRARMSLLAVLLVAFCVPASAQAAGTITATAGGARSILNTDGGYANPLSGVAFEKAPWVSDPATASWSALCTTLVTGACSSASLTNGRYLVREAPTAGPSGWRTLTTLAWGGGSSGSSPARGYVGDVTITNGSAVTVRPSTSWSPTAPATGSGAFIAAKDNPALPTQCGLDVLLLLDRSGSITSQRDVYKAAAKQLVGALAGTPTRLKIFSFAQSASADQNSFLDLTIPADVIAANGVIDDVYAATGGATNWDAGMTLAAGSAVDTAIFVTDGNPTYRNSTSSGANADAGSTVDLLDLTAGVAAANKVKVEGKSGGAVLAAGATVLGVGAGTGVTASNLAAVSGPVEGTDYFTTSIAGLGGALQRIANQLCGARIHVRKLTDDGDATAAKAGWDVTAGKPGGSPAVFTPAALTTTGLPADDVINVDKIPGAGASGITVSETQKAGYAFVASACQKDSFSSPASGGATTTTIATLRRNEDWYCTFRNSHTGRLIVTKQTLPDGDPTAFGFTTTATGAGTFSLTDGATESRAVAPGTYTATETANAGWELASLVCDDTDSTIDKPTGIATFRVAPGETVTCVYTNTKNGTLIVEKRTTPAGDPTRFDFATDASGARSFALADGQGESRSVAPGDYSVTEAIASGYRLTGLGCTDADSTGTLATRTAAFVIAPGETVTCTFRNALVDTALAVVKSGPAFAYHGDTLSFRFGVTNPGGGDLTGVQVSDDRCAPVTVGTQTDAGGQPDATPGVLNVGDVWIYECSMTAPAHTANETNPVVNTVTVTAVDEFDRPASATGEHSTRLLHPAVAIAKSGPATAQAGGPVTYGLDVTNPGDVPFLSANVSVGDALCEAPPALTTTNGDSTPGQLDPGDRWSYTCIVRTIVGQTQVVNVGVVTAIDSFGGHPVTDDDQVTTTLTAPPVVVVVTPPPPPTGTVATRPPAAAALPAATPAARIPAQSSVLGATDSSGNARLSGPGRCVSRPFTVSVRGSKIRQVTFSVDRRKRGTVKAKSGRKVFSLRIDPRRQSFGVHRLSAVVRFTAASETASRRLKLVYQRCPKAAVLPQFTG